jgi:hypothetical protein
MVDGDQLKEKAQDKAQSTLKVTDRRLFTSSGELRQELPDEPEIPPAPAPRPAPARVSEPEPGPVGFERQSIDEPAGIDFTGLINAMMQPALIYLGEIPHPATGEPIVDLEQARMQIDMLDLLRVKTRGNLSSQEQSFLERVLYQLRMLYVSRSGKKG